MTTLTLVIPTYNLGHYFDETLKTIAEQTVEFELWLVNDHSTDGTAEKASDFVSERPTFHVEQFKQHRGVSAARNFGLAHATGDVIAFADGDDQLDPDYVKTLVNGFKNGVVAVAVGYLWWHTTIDQRNVYLPMSQREMFNQVSHRGTDVGGYIWNKAYSLAAIREADLQFDESLSIAEDYLFTASYVAKTPGVYVYDPALRYTKVNRPGSTIHTRNLHDQRVEEQVFSYIRRLGESI